MLVATIIAVLFSFFAFGFSIYALWVVRVSPYRLIVYPPALSYLNRKEASLVLDMTFFNPGRVRVALLDMEITPMRRGLQVSGSFRPCAYSQTSFPQSGHTSRHSIISRFTPFLINKQETATQEDRGEEPVLQRAKAIAYDGNEPQKGNSGKRSQGERES